MNNSSTLVVYTIMRSTFVGRFAIAYFKTHEQAVAFTKRCGHKNLEIVEKDGVYNGIIKIKSAEQFHGVPAGKAYQVWHFSFSSAKQGSLVSEFATKEEAQARAKELQAKNAIAKYRVFAK